MHPSISNPDLEGIAIIGLAGRFPGARNATEFWDNLKSGIESISRFAVEDLEVRDAARQSQDPTYIKARGVLDDVDLFDAGFFGIYPQEARLMDPQHRVFLECCWEALEDAGQDPSRGPAPVGVFAGCSQNSYFFTQVCSGKQFLQDYSAAYQVGFYPTMLGAMGDTLATRVAYKLNLQGPAVTLLCACSTSLVAVCQACTNLLTWQCDLALAGGVSISFPQKRGYLYQAGGMVSPDGHCRAFDEDAQGTVFGAGVGVVVLKRMEEAFRDGDHIYAVIKGSAVNNDGSGKVGFTAPSVDGQAKVIRMAQAIAGADPRSIGYIEAHGTGTPLGDPIELAALSQVFRESTQDTGFCALGTAKTNVGHLDVASGVTGLIKTALSLEHKQLPASLNFRRPNPRLNLETSPFFVNTELRDWDTSAGHPRRAGVSAFGVGGTNAHVVLEEAPPAEFSASPRPCQLLTISAKSPEALAQAELNLAEHLRRNPESHLEDVAYTLQAGRRSFDHRATVVCSNASQAVEALTGASGRPPAAAAKPEPPKVHFLFPGQGVQHVNMGLELYRTERKFRETVDRCAEILLPLLGEDLRGVIYPAGGDEPAARERLNQTRFAQPAIFTIEYALTELWMHWGVRPKSMAGHSVGEFVCACLAGVFSLEDALALIAERGRLMQSLPGGAMLAVRLPESQILPLLDGALSLAAVNAPSLSVVSGPFDNIAALEAQLSRDRIASRRLHTSHAFHSSMMDPILEPFTGRVRRISLAAPVIPYLSCVTGRWITDAQATDPEYWARHFRQPVRFSDAILELRGKSNEILLEAGPGTTLQTLARQHPVSGGGQQTVISSMPESGSANRSESNALMQALGRLWTEGFEPAWDAFYEDERRRRVPLPSYPFERKRYWMEPSGAAENDGDETVTDSPPREETSEAKSMQNVTQPETNMESRKARIVPALVTILQDLSGMETSEIDPAASFLELGFDSLFLTQVTQAVQSKFGLKITFRQLLDQLSSINALASYLDEQLPPSAMQESPRPQPSLAPAAPIAPALPSFPSANGPGAQAPLPAASSAIESLLQQQLQAMSQLISGQLEVLRANGSASAAAQPTPPPQPAAPAPAPAPVEKEFKPFGPYKPIQRGASGDMSPRQTAYINTLIERYAKKTQESKRLTQKYRPVLADPRVAAGFRSQWKEIVYPLVTNRSHGSRLWDVDGNEYIDLLNGFGPIAFGHIPDFVADAVAEQLKQGIEIGPQTPLAGEVAELLCELTGMERATFCNTGSEAVMAAMRLARTVTGRKKVVIFAGDYHGNFEEVLVKRIGRGDSLRSGPIAPGIAPEAVENMIVLDYGAPEALETIRQHASELAAVLLEPVQSRHPELRPREFLLQLREITAASGTALIFDEVVTGFRVHQGGAQAMYGIQADIATYGKVLGGGLPIGAIAGKARFMDALDGGMWSYGDDSYPETGVTFFAGTFVRHPLAMAAARAVLRHLKESGPALQEQLTQRTGKFVDKLNRIFERYNVPSRIGTCGSWFYFGFPSDFRFGSLLYYHLREKGVHILEGFPCFLTTAHSDADLDQVERAFEESCLEMQAGGVLAQTESRATAAADATPDEVPEAPLTESQLEIWLSAQLSPEASCSYNESFTVSLAGELNRTALTEALSDLLVRHDALRSRFDPEGGCFRIEAPRPVKLPLADLTTQADPALELWQILEREARTPFDLSQGPLVRLSLVRLGPARHVLVFTSHHIVCDGWSTNVILSELASLYNAKCQNTGANLAPALSFLKYAIAQKEEAGSAKQGAAENFWLKQFADLPPVLDLPLDRPRPPVKAFHGATLRRTIDEKLYRELKKAGARQGCTLFATLLASFQALLGRLTGQDDLVVGIPAAGQSLLENQILVGHCVNFLPLRARIPETGPFAQFLAEGKRRLLDAYEHQTVTYGTLVRKLGIVRDPSRLPLVEAQFNLEQVGKGIHFHQLEAEIDSCAKQFVNFDIFLNVVESQNGLVLDCDFNTGLFDEATIARWLSHYETLLRSVAAAMDRPVAELAILDETQRQDLLFRRNRNEADYPRHKCIHELVEQRALEAPNAIAAVFEDESMTYAALNASANRLANFLKKQGVGPNRLAAIYLERSARMVVAMLGVLKAGGAYLPLDPSYPKERLDFILSDARPQVVITEEHLAIGLGSIDKRVLCLDAGAALIAREPAAAPECGAKPEDLAYTIYTSGSTGQPKGVEIPHRAVVNFLWSMLQKPGLSEKDRLLAVTTLSFDIAGLEIFLPLVAGGRVVVAGKEATADGLQLARLIQEHGITAMQATPSTWRLLLEAEWKPTGPMKMLCGGEALPRDLADQLLGLGGELWNMYGPTETTIWSAVSLVNPGPAPVLIGPPIANTQFYVLDSRRQPVPLGVPGELYIGGDGLARGYYNRPDLTLEKFLADPFRGADGSRMYRTGDLVRALPDGMIEFLGRLDHQVKIRGFRVELGEIETVLQRHEQIKETVVVVNESSGAQRLVCYFTASNGVEPAANELKTFVSTTLPPYMVPAFFVCLPEIPRTPNGKLNRKALPAPDPSLFAGSKRRMQPARNHTEETLAEICKEVLQLDEISMEDNLFELGADSIQIFRIVARANRAGIGLTAQEILRHPTIEGCSNPASMASPHKEKLRLGPIVPVRREAYRSEISEVLSQWHPTKRA